MGSYCISISSAINASLCYRSNSAVAVIQSYVTSQCDPSFYRRSNRKKEFDSVSTRNAFDLRTQNLPFAGECYLRPNYTVTWTFCTTVEYSVFDGTK